VIAQAWYALPIVSRRAIVVASQVQLLPVDQVPELVAPPLDSQSEPSSKRQIQALIHDGCSTQVLCVRLDVVPEILLGPLGVGWTILPALRKMSTGKIIFRLNLTIGNNQAGVFVEHRETNVDMVQQHERRGGAAKVLHSIMQGNTAFTQVRGDSSIQTQILAEDFGLAHRTGDAQHIVVAVSGLRYRHIFGGSVPNATVQPQLLPFVDTRLADLAQPAGREQPARKGVEPFVAVGIVVRGCDDAIT
jgi:hypothetical protein